VKNQLNSVNVGTSTVVFSSLLLALAVFPHIFQIEKLVILSFSVMVAWKLLSLWNPWVPVNRWLIIAFAVISFSISAWYYGPPIGRDPGVSFLITLLGLKILESRTRRDFRIVLALGYFVVITHFLYINQLPVVFFLFVLVFALTVLMIQISHVNPSAQLKSDIRLAVKLVVQAIPFALILFFLFPRFAGSLWLLQSPTNSGVTGMSDTLTLGKIAQLVGSKEVAFTATFPDKKVPVSSARYWRAGVLWDTDGREWVRGSSMGRFKLSVTSLSEPYHYEIEMQPTRNSWLFALDIPIEQPDGAILSEDLYLYKNNITESPATYSITSSDNYINRTMNASQRQRGTRLVPEMRTRRMMQFVEQLITSSTVNQQFDENRYAVGVLDFFNKNSFTYTLQPPRLLSDAPIDEFLFSSRKGFCEHYATGFVTLMRAANVPARVVIGYLGGEYNPLTNQITVRQSDAHAWAEFWSESRGWVRIDPTAVIAPERIDSQINYDLSINSNGDVKYLSLDLGALGSLLREFRWYSGLVKLQWERWFVGFDFTRQRALLNALGMQNFNLQTLAILAFLSGLFILVCSAFLFYRNDRNKVDKVARLYELYCKKLSGQGIERKVTEGPVDYYARCIEKFPELEGKLQHITHRYTALRYGVQSDRGVTTAQLQELESEIKNLEFS
jgi:transglutaminase-like putative cysteine protease